MGVCGPSYKIESSQMGSTRATILRSWSEPKQGVNVPIAQRVKNEEWLGDQESNLGSQNQNLLSCP